MWLGDLEREMVDEQRDVEPGFLTEKLKGFFGRLNSISLTARLSIQTSEGIEKYVLACFSVELVIAILLFPVKQVSPLPGVLLVFFASLRIADILQASINAVLFGKKVASPNRTLILAAINCFELGMCFGFISAAHLGHLFGASRAATGIYLSFITQLTIGYGDVYPTGWLRIVAVIQGLVAALFVILVLGRIVASIRPLDRDKRQ